MPLLAAWLVALAPWAVDAARPVVLVAAFEPFEGRPVNESQVAARRLDERARAGGRYRVVRCDLPVIYDVASARLLECLGALPEMPGLVLLLGEGACETRLETTARVWDDAPGYTDNLGAIRDGLAIDPDGPEILSIGAMSDVDPLAVWEALPWRTRERVSPSIDLQGLVGANAVWRFEQAVVGGAWARLPRMFVHVPQTNCGVSDHDRRVQLADLDRIVSEALRQAGTGAPHFSSFDQTQR
mgnify:CR=1 FL=1